MYLATSKAIISAGDRTIKNVDLELSVKDLGWSKELKREKCTTIIII